jgi:glycosyltransferase involved in cell wall biosynthesis
MKAWEQLPNLPLTIVGDGPLLVRLREQAASRLARVEFLGELPHDRVLDLVGTSGMVIFPSLWYEGLPYVLLEALANGIPIITSDIGAQAEVVSDGISGLLFKAGDADALATTVRRLVASEELARRLARGAREAFLERYSIERSYEGLIDVYERVRGTAHAKGG